MGVEIEIKDLTKSFGKQLIWGDVTLTIPAGEICVMLGPSGTGKSVFLKTLVGLLRPDRGSVWINVELVGLQGAEGKLPGEISGGMRKRAGLARALVLDPEIILFDEPDSGLDPVRTAFLNQLIVDLNAQIDATFLIVTHDINTARTVPDNIGLLYHKHLAMFGSMNLYDNIAFPLREHTKKSESDIRKIVMEKLDLTGLIGTEDKLPGEISGGMRKRAGLARALVLDPEIVLFDEPDSGLDPVRTAFLNQLIVDLNAQIDATFLIVTHDINTARTVPDNIGLLYHRHLAMFGPREQLLSSEEPVVRQFLNAQRVGPIGMSEEKDADELAAEAGQELPPLPPIPLQLDPSNGIPRRSQRPAGEWCRENGVTPPPGSFESSNAGLAPGV